MKKMMKALLFYWDSAHWPLAREALLRAGRRDLIGKSPRCLVPPERAGSRPRAERSAKRAVSNGTPKTPPQN
jgi:hypothetical protein